MLRGDFIAGNLAETQQITREQYVHWVDPVFSAQTATGQTYHSDSRMLFLALNGRATNSWKSRGCCQVAVARRRAETLEFSKGSA